VTETCSNELQKILQTDRLFSEKEKEKTPFVWWLIQQSTNYYGKAVTWNKPYFLRGFLAIRCWKVALY